jgi:hypothetical protein
MPRPGRRALALTPLFVLACHASQSPVLDFDDVALRTASGRVLGQDEVRTVLLAALHQKRWTVDADEPGAITAGVYAGGHSAKVRIDYRAGAYSIRHQSSTPGLRYDPERQIIHKRYNHWVDRLRLAIHANVPAD